MDVSVGLEVAPGVGCSVGDGVGGFEHAPVCMHTIALPSPEPRIRKGRGSTFETAWAYIIKVHVL